MFNPFTSKLRIELNEIKHKHTLELQELRAAFVREQKNWVEDKARLESQMKKDHELKLNEAIVLTRLSSEQKIKQIEIDNLRSIEELKSSTSRDVFETKKLLSEEYYQKLSEALNKLHTEGNLTTKFTQELALKMLEKAPPQTNRIELLEGKVETRI